MVNIIYRETVSGSIAQCALYGGAILSSLYLLLFAKMKWCININVYYGVYEMECAGCSLHNTVFIPPR